MNKNINNGVELTEKELACVCGGGLIDDLIEDLHRQGKSDQEIARELAIYIEGL